MSNGNNVYFIVGHHGIGKTYLLNQLSKSFKLLHIDTGPQIRSIYTKQTEGKISIGEWVSIGEELAGEDFTNIVLCQEIEESIRNINDCPIFITGNRSLDGIEYISKYFGFTGKAKIIYLDASFDLLKDNYETREKKDLSDGEFRVLLDKEIQAGLNDVRDYTISNLETCIYHYKKTNDGKIYDSLKEELSRKALMLKKGNKKNDENIVGNKF